MIALSFPPGDLAINSGSAFSINGAPYAVQKVQVRCQFFLGEWFLNSLEGVPYFRDILIKNPNPDTVRSVYRRAILSVPGITSVTSLSYVVDPKTRTASVSFQATYQDGQPQPVSLSFIV